jgi:hypothetical protein
MNIKPLSQEIGGGLVASLLRHWKDLARGFRHSVYCSMNIAWSVLNIGPVTIPVEIMRREIRRVRVGQELRETAGNRRTIRITDPDVDDWRPCAALAHTVTTHPSPATSENLATPRGSVYRELPRALRPESCRSPVLTAEALCGHGRRRRLECPMNRFYELHG